MLAALLWAWPTSAVGVGRLLALAALVALPVGFSLALVAGAQRAGASIDRFIESTGLADVVVFTGGEPGTEVLERIAADRRIAALDRTNTVVIVPVADGAGESGFALVGTDGAPVGGFGSPMLLSGRYPSAGAATRSWSTSGRRRNTGSRSGCGRRCPGSCRSGRGRPVRSARRRSSGSCARRSISSTTRRRSRSPWPGQGSSTATGASSPARERSCGSTLHDRSDVGAVVSDLSTIVDGDVRGASDLLSTAERAAGLQRRGLLLAGGVVAAAGMLVIAQAVARHLAVRSEDSDVLASIGLTRGERWMAATLSVAPALAAGIVIGAALAVGLSPLLPLGLPRRADPDVGLHADWVVLALGLAAAVVLSRRRRRRRQSGDGCMPRATGSTPAGRGCTAGFGARIAPGRR